MKKSLLVIVALAVGVAAGVRAQQATFSRVVLQQVDISAPGREAVTALATFPAGAAAGRHTHPGEEIGYVIEGTVLVEIDGQPSATVPAGKAFFIPANTVHNATNTGTSPARVLANYVVEKGKPMATPAAAPVKK